MKTSSAALFCLGCILVLAPLNSAMSIWDRSSEDSDDPDWLPPVQRPVPYIFFIDHDYDHDVVDFDDLYDNDIDTGDMMIALPNNWIDLTLGDVNDAVAACRTRYCRPYEACVVGDSFNASCECPTASLCDRLQTPQVVCASNGQTYTNRCLLRVDECTGGQLIRVLHRGQCRQRTAEGRRRFGSRVGSNASGGR